MTLLEKIKEDSLIARKGLALARKESNISQFAILSIASDLLVTLLGEAVMKGKNEGRETTDEDVISTINKFIKNGKDTLKALATDDVRRLTTTLEIETLEKYLPKQMDVVELRAAVDKIIFDKGLDRSKQMKGLVMKTLKERHEGTYGGEMAAKVVDAALTPS